MAGIQGHAIKTKKKMKDGWYINKLAEISALFNQKSVSPKFIELCLETSHENQD